MSRLRDGAVAAAALAVTVAVPVLLLLPRTPAVPVERRAAVLRPLVVAAPTRRLFRGGLDDPAVPEVTAGTGGDVPMLVGVIGRLPNAVALVRNADGRSRAVALGGTAGTWRLEGIAADRAVFTRGGERVRVRLATE